MCCYVLGEQFCWLCYIQGEGITLVLLRTWRRNYLGFVTYREKEYSWFCYVQGEGITLVLLRTGRRNNLGFIKYVQGEGKPFVLLCR